MFVVFILYFDVIVFAYCPVEMCCSCLLKLPTYFAHWVGAIFQDLVWVVVGLDALILGSKNETFCFWFEARCSILSQMWVSAWSATFSVVLFGYYADDTQLYLSFKPTPAEQASSITRIEACVSEIDSWMVSNKLKLNREKTELLVLSARHHPPPSIEYIDVSGERIKPLPHLQGTLELSSMSTCH